MRLIRTARTLIILTVAYLIDPIWCMMAAMVLFALWIDAPMEPRC